MQDVNSSNMHLAILRHGDANWPLPGQSDFHRELSAAGDSESQRVALYLNEINFRPEVIVCSGATRCVQTLAALRKHHDFKAATDISDELFHSDVEEYLTAIRRHKNASTVLLIGHNPTLEDLLVQLLGPDVAQSAVPFGLQTAGLVILELRISSNGSMGDATLIDSFAP